MCLPSDTDVRPQVGSYFGATLCTLDQGGVTVALLVGAPSHYDGRRGGRVHVYRWKEVRRGQGHTRSTARLSVICAAGPWREGVPAPVCRGNKSIISCKASS